MSKLWLIAALSVAMVATTLPAEVEAKRLGSGKSSGMQRNMPARTAPDAPPAKPATPAQGQQATPATPAAAPAAAAAAPKRNWMGPLAGLAAGLGIAALLSHFGMGGAAADFLMMALLAGGAVFLVMFLLRRFAGGAGRQPALAGAGASAGGGSSSGPAWSAQPAAPAPLQRTSFEPAATATAAPVSASAPGVNAAFVPASFDSESFARTAKEIFIRLQAANDTADLDDLRRFTTPELFASLRLDLQERGSQAQSTDVLNVQTQVLDVAQEDGRQVVSVRFHGQLVEDKGGTPVDFNEVWHLVKPLDDSRAWAIAGIEQMS